MSTRSVADEADAAIETLVGLDVAADASVKNLKKVRKAALKKQEQIARAARIAARRVQDSVDDIDEQLSQLDVDSTPPAPAGTGSTTPATPPAQPVAPADPEAPAEPAAPAPAAPEPAPEPTPPPTQVLPAQLEPQQALGLPAAQEPPARPLRRPLPHYEGRGARWMMFWSILVGVILAIIGLIIALNTGHPLLHPIGVTANWAAWYMVVLAWLLKFILGIAWVIFWVGLGFFGGAWLVYGIHRLFRWLRNEPPVATPAA